jgi:hypothetical protein
MRFRSHNSDIDLVVDWPGQIWNKKLMRKLGRHIERSGHGRRFQYILGAKVHKSGRPLANIGSHHQIRGHLRRNRYRHFL